MLASIHTTSRKTERIGKYVRYESGLNIPGIIFPVPVNRINQLKERTQKFR